jgi:hypothetical protein
MFGRFSRTGSPGPPADRDLFMLSDICHPAYDDAAL